MHVCDGTCRERLWEIGTPGVAHYNGGQRASRCFGSDSLSAYRSIVTGSKFDERAASCGLICMRAVLRAGCFAGHGIWASLGGACWAEQGGLCCVV